MPRPRKQNAEYFSHDADASEDAKVAYLEARFGHMGYALYFKLLERLCRCDNFEMPFNDILAAGLSRQFNVTIEQFNEFIVAATSRDVAAFRYENALLWSDGMKKRMSYLVEKRQKDADRIAQKRAENTQEKDNTLRNGVVAATMQQSKVKESKVKKRNTPLPPEGEVGEGLPPDPVLLALAGFSDPAEMARQWNRWKVYKLEQHKFRYKSQDSEITGIKNLLNLSKGSTAQAVAILDHTIGNTWEGFVVPRTNGASPHTSSTASETHYTPAKTVIFGN